MLLALDVGNSQVYGGVYEGDTLKLQFRKNTRLSCSSDEYGLFLKTVLRENNLNPDKVQAIVVSSVVPDLMHSLGNACVKYFGIDPLVLQPGLKTGLKITTRNPTEVGADLIATAIAAVNQFSNRNLIIIDFGTATTVSVVDKNKAFLGAMIMPGMKVSMLALEQYTAKLPKVEIAMPSSVIGRSTSESIQSGLYYSTVGMIREVVSQIKAEKFVDDGAVVIGTGGFARLFEPAKLFDATVPELILHGLKKLSELNK